MRASHLRVGTGILLAALSAIVAGSCNDAAGPALGVPARFAVAPSFASSAASRIDIRTIRFILNRTADASVARDTVIDIPPDADSVELVLDVAVLTHNETFELFLELRDAIGLLVFTGGPVTVTPTTSGPPPVVEIPITYVGIGANAASVELLPPAAISFFGLTTLFQGIARDGGGAPIPGTPIAFISLDPELAAVAVADSGRVIAGTARGTARIVAQLLTGPADTATLLVQPVPTDVLADSGGGQVALIDVALPDPLVARVLAADNGGVQGIWVRFVTILGNGTLSAESVLTDAAGRARVLWTLGDGIGTQAAIATVGTLPTDTALFLAQAESPLGVALEIVSGDQQSGTVGMPLAQPLVVRATDALAAAAVGDTVDWSVIGGEGAVEPAFSITDASGEASTTWTLGPVADGGHLVRAQLRRRSVDVSFGAGGVADAAQQLAFAVQPSATTVDSPITPALEVVALDQFGNLATTYTGDVSVAILDNPGGGTLLGSTTVAAVGGVAQFPDLSIDLVGVGYTLEATAAGLTSATSSPFDIVLPAGQVAWTNASGGTWSTATNWSTGVVPGVNETVLITLNGTYTVTLDVDTTVAAVTVGGTSGMQTLALGGSRLTVGNSLVVEPSGVLDLTSGTLGGTGLVSVAGTLNWTGGTMTDAGTTLVESGGTLVLDGGTKNLTGGRQLELRGTGTWSAGTIQGGSASQFLINTAGTFTIAGDVTYNNAFGGELSIFNNFGTVVRASTIGEASLDVFVANNGSLDVQTGTLALRAGGTSGGAFTVQGGATLEFGGNHGLLNTASVTGSGTVLVTTGNVSVSGGYSISGTTASGGAVNFEAPASTSVLTLNGGTVGGSATLTVLQSFDWTAGSLSGTGATQVDVAATLSVGGTTKNLTGGYTLHTAGATTWSAGTIQGGSGSQIVNAVGATFTITGNVTYNNAFGGTLSGFTNFGTLIRSTSVGQANLDIAVTNDGSLDVQTGTLALRNGGTSGGAFTVQGGAALQFGAGTHVLSGSSSISGAGAVHFSAGSVTVGGAYGPMSTVANGGTVAFDAVASTDALAVSGGTYGGAGAMTVLTTFDWTGGSLSGTGSTRLDAAATATLGGSTKNLMGGYTLSNAGTATWSAGTIQGGNASTFRNEAGASLSITGDVTYNNAFGGLTSSLVNEGTLIRSVSTGVAFLDVIVTNDGAIDIQSGTLALRTGGTSGGAFTVQGGATLQFGGGTHTLAAGSSVGGTGTVHAVGGSVTISGSYAVAATTVGGGTALFDVGATTDVLTVNGSGTLGGIGTIAALTRFTWSAGSLNGTGTTQVDAAATLTIDGGTKNLIGGYTLSHAGTGTWSAGTIQGGNASTFRNEAGATLAITGDVGFNNAFGGTTSTLVNDGTLTRSSSAGQVNLDVPLTHTGTLDVQTGTLAIRAGAALTGAITVASGAALDIPSATVAFADGFTAAGTGPVRLLGSGTIDVGTGTVTLPLFEQTGGTVMGTGTLVLTSFSWSGGTQTDAGLTRIGSAGSAVLTGLTSRTLSAGRIIENNGTLSWTDGTISTGTGAGFVNNGAFSVTGTVALDFVLGGVAPTFTNNGALDVQAPATFDLEATFTHAAGAALFGTGTLDLSPPATIALFEGDVSPGLSPGVLSIIGPLPQATASTLLIELAGTSVGTGYDQLAVSGTATLDGTAAFVTTFAPSPGDLFTPFTFGSRSGQFATVAPFDLWPVTGVGMALDTVWTATALTVVADAQVVFSADSFGSLPPSGLFRTNGNGDFVENVSDEGAFIDTWPRWEPGFKRLTHTASNLLHVIDAARQSTPAHLVNDASARRARFSPNGVHLAFECGPLQGLIDDVCAIRDVTAATATLNDIGNATGKAWVTDSISRTFNGSAGFAWDPLNPDQLIVARDTVLAAGEPSSNLYRVNFDGTGITRIATMPAFRQIKDAIDFAPDGSLIAFALHDVQTLVQEIWVVDRNGGGLQRVSSPPAGSMDLRPVFSPDSREILFARLDASLFVHYVITDGVTERVEIAGSYNFDNGDRVGHDWSPDGSRIVLVDVNATQFSSVVYVVPSGVASTAEYLGLRRILGRQPNSLDLFDKHPSWRP